MITTMAVIEYILQIKSQKKEQAFATYGIVGFIIGIEPDDAVSGESLFLFWLFICKIYSITAMLVIIFVYIIHTIMAKSTIQHISKFVSVRNNFFLSASHGRLHYLAHQRHIPQTQDHLRHLI